MRAFVLSLLFVILLASCTSPLFQPASPVTTTALETPSSTLSPIVTVTARPTIWYTPSSHPTIAVFTTPDAMHLMHWKEYEEALARVVKRATPPEKVLCEWTILGYSESTIYVWALCAEHIRDDFYPAVSVPAAIYIGPNGEAVEVKIPEPGMNYGPSIRRMFPEDIQEKIFHFQEWLDVEQLKVHLIYRFEHLGVPPLIVLSATPTP